MPALATTQNTRLNALVTTKNILETYSNAQATTQNTVIKALAATQD